MTKPSTCRGCPLFNAPGPVWTTPGEILFVGEAPRRSEIVQNKGFVGKSGKMLWRLAGQAGLEASRCGRANVVKCQPPKGEKGKQLPPSDAAVEHCRQHLEKDLAEHAGKVVVAVGGTALEALLDETGIMRCRGRVFRRERHLIIPIIHPAFILHKWEWDWLPVMWHDLARVQEVATNGWVEPAVPVNSDLPLPSGGDPDIDIETDGSAITTIGVGWTQDGREVFASRAFPTEGLAAMMAGADEVGLQNAQFDIPRLMAAGMPRPKKIFDTMVGSAILDPNLPNDLEFIASVYTRFPLWKHLAKLEPEHYNLMDVAVTRASKAEIRNQLWATGQLGVFETSMKVLPLAMQMTIGGVAADVEAMKRMAKACWERERKIDEELYQEVAKCGKRMERVRAMEQEALGCQQQADGEGSKREANKLRTKSRKTYEKAAQLARPNFGSTHQVGPLLFDMGLKKSAKGTNDEPTLRNIARVTGHVLPRLIVDRRKVARLRGTYFTQKRLGVDGKFHPDWYVCRNTDDESGSRFSRWSSNGPNMQNWPSDCMNCRTRFPCKCGDNLSAKTVIVADDVESELVEVDLEKAEFAVIAWKAGDGMYERVMQPGFNPYVEFGVHAYNETVKKGTRRYWLCKTSTLSGCYKIGPIMFARERTKDDIYIEVKEAKRLLGILPTVFPQIRNFWRDVAAEGKMKRFVVNPFGRRRPFLGPAPDVPEMLNFFPQSTVGDIINRAAAEIAEVELAEGFGYEKDGWRTIIQEHDKFVFSVKKWKTPSLAVWLKEVFETTHPEMPGFQPMAEVKRGKNWGEMEDLK
jgi:DNA polymerase